MTSQGEEMDEIERLLDLQDGVIARWQALSAGQSPTAIARRVRRRDWVRIHPGVYLNHTGTPSWLQRAWAAVLACWPSALDGYSALRAHEGPGRRTRPDDGPIHVVISAERRVIVPDGVVVRRSRRFLDAAQTNLSPPRLRYDDTVIDLADRATDDLSAIAILADACGGHRTTASRLRECATRMARLRRRRWLEQILDDVAEGTCSVLEHGYLDRVERPHGLPRGRRQAAATDSSGRRMFRDVVYSGTDPTGRTWRLIVELDGRLDHTSAKDRDRDLERDLDAALDRIDRAATIRLGYRQVYDRPCSTAAKLQQLVGGLSGVPVTGGCAACDRGGSRQAG